MSWSRFKFYCIEVLRQLERGQDVMPAFEDVRASLISAEFGVELKPREIQSFILESLKKDGYTTEEVKAVLGIYNNLDLSALIHKPSRIRRVGVYIVYLTFVYFVLSGLYAVYVIPNMSLLFESMEIPAPENFVWLASHWTTLLIVVFSVLIVALLVSETIKQLFDYKVDIEKSVLYRLLLPVSLRARYEKVTSLLRLPLHVVKNKSDGINDEIIQYYFKQKYQAKEISKSLSILVDENVSNLVILSEAHMRRIYVVVAILIIFSIIEFVVSAYAPLFTMGEIV
jgi:hypothetical protein